MVRKEKINEIKRKSYSFQQFSFGEPGNVNADDFGKIVKLRNAKVYNGEVSQAFSLIDGALLRVDGTTRVLPKLSVGIYPINAAILKITGESATDLLVVQGSNYKIYYTYLTGTDTSFTESSLTLNGKAEFLNCYLSSVPESAMLIFDPLGGLFIMHPNGTLSTYQSGPLIKSPVYHYLRVWGTDGHNKVFFSNDDDPTNFSSESTGGGTVLLPDEYGRILKLVSYKDALYLFKEKAIFRLTAYADPGAFTISKVLVTDGAVSGGSVAEGNGKIYYAAGKRIFEFDGFTATPVFAAVEHTVENYAGSQGIVFNGSYYLSATVNDDTEYENALIRLYLDGNGIEYFNAFKVGSFLTVSYPQGQYLLVLGAVSAQQRALQTVVFTQDMTMYDNDYVPSLAVTADTNLGSPDKKKALKRLYASVESDTAITVRMDSAPYAQTLSAVKIVEDRAAQLTHFDCDACGTLFRLTFTGLAARQFYIKALTFEATENRELRIRTIQ
ncbi:MAG: hypothetical protein LBN25_04920 [Christensenellaceae bacterium]|jgi:hypothetical protein|nr:hypothetical protein [Christensenellaceae bacterium]